MEKHYLSDNKQIWIYRYITNLATLRRSNLPIIFAIF